METKPGRRPVLFEKLIDLPVHISKLIDSSIDFGRFGLNFEYFKIAENEYSKESLLKIRNIVSTLFLAETSYDKELLEQELLCLFNDETDCEAISLLVNWFKQLSIHGRIDAEDSKLLEEIYYTKEEAESMLITALKKEKKATYQKGKLEGRLEGKVEGKLETAKSMLREGFDIELVAKITELTHKEISTIAKSLS